MSSWCRRISSLTRYLTASSLVALSLVTGTPMPIRIVLVEPQHPGNIGAVARAMKNMGLRDLHLVQPALFPHQEATARASGADDVLERRARACTLRSGDCGLRPHRRHQRTSAAFALGIWLNRASAAHRSCRRRTTGDCRDCFRCRTHRTDQCRTRALQSAADHSDGSDYSSLNLAMAVQVVAYELWLASRPGAPPPPERDVPLATAEEMTRLVRAHRTGAGGNRFQGSHRRRSPHDAHSAAVQSGATRSERNEHPARYPDGSSGSSPARRRPTGSHKRDHEHAEKSVRLLILQSAHVTSDLSRLRSDDAGRSARGGTHDRMSAAGRCRTAIRRRPAMSSAGGRARWLRRRERRSPRDRRAAAMHRVDFRRDRIGQPCDSRRSAISRGSRPTHRVGEDRAQGRAGCAEAARARRLRCHVSEAGHERHRASRAGRRSAASDTQLVSLMHVNNETGVIQDVAAVGTFVASAACCFTVDAAQSVGKLPIDVEADAYRPAVGDRAQSLWPERNRCAVCASHAAGRPAAAFCLAAGRRRAFAPARCATHQIVGMGAAFELASADAQRTMQRAACAARSAVGRHCVGRRR